MKHSFIVSLLTALVFFCSCEKEYSVENGGLPTGTTGGTAKYTLAGGSGSCTGATTDGTFMSGIAATTTNTVTVQVTVDSIGTYAISTSTVNGISFSGSGSFNTVGTQPVLLIATGTPATAGDFNFTAGTSGCSFTVTVASGGGGSSGTASFSYGGGTGTCTGAILSGTYTAGTALTAANTVKLQVTVDTIGTYTISTASVNGFSFSGSGAFTTTGVQTITLNGSGIPLVTGTYNLNPINACSFAVTVIDGSSASGYFLKCKIDGVETNFNANLIAYNIPPPSAGIPYSISVQGKISDVAGGTQELWVTVQSPGNPVVVGIYNNLTILNSMESGSLIGYYPTGFPNLYWGTSGISSNIGTVNITSLAGNVAIGTFSCTAKENNGLGPLSKEITEGSFKVKY